MNKVENRSQSIAIIAVTFMVALMLAIVPLPYWAKWWRPDWAGMVLFYWSIALPQRVGVATGWTVGLCHDVLSDTLLGQHALRYALLAYVGVAFHHRLRLFPHWQQASWVFFLILGGQILEIWVHGIQGYPPTDFSFVYPALITAVLWRWAFIGLRDLRRFYKVS